MLTKFSILSFTITFVVVLVSFFFGVTLNTPASTEFFAITSQSDHQAFCPRRLLATGFLHHTPQRFDGNLLVHPLPGHKASVSHPGLCSRTMLAAMDGTLMSQVNGVIRLITPMSEASGYGNKVLFTPSLASQCWRGWPVFTRLQFSAALETYPEGGAPLGWEIELMCECCGYQAPTGSDGIELRQDVKFFAHILSPSKSKPFPTSSRWGNFERRIHVYAAMLAHESLRDNTAETLLLHSSLRSTQRRSIWAVMLKPRQIEALKKADQKDRPAMKANFAKQNQLATTTTAQSTSAGRQPKAKATPSRTRLPGGKPLGGGSAPFSLDPLHPVPFPSAVAAGKALPLTALVEKDFTVHTRTRMLVATNVGNSGTVAFLLDINDTSDVLESVELLTFPTIKDSDLQGGPTAGRAMKFSVAVTNVTSGFKRAGRVTYLNSGQRLPGPLGTPAAWTGINAIVAAVKTHPSRRRITGDVLKDPKQLVGFVCDQPAYHGYAPWRGTLNIAEFISHALSASSSNPISDISISHQRPMSVIAWVFDPTEDAQSYSITIRGSYYTRWPLTTVPGQSMRMSPTAPQHTINQQHQHAEEGANNLGAVAAKAAVATGASRAAGWLSDLATEAAPQLRRMAMEGLEGAMALG